ncbi:hypothetical protein TNCV_2837381 [Trichonephila clavipes]|nr:hypothetical protein TNCV_2837381 [Trichonephila clavipes]
MRDRTRDLIISESIQSKPVLKGTCRIIKRHRRCPFIASSKSTVLGRDQTRKLGRPRPVPNQLTHQIVGKLKLLRASQ